MKKTVRLAAGTISMKVVNMLKNKMKYRRNMEEHYLTETEAL